MARATRSSKRRTGAERFKWTKELIMLLSGLGLVIALTIWALIPTKSERFLKEWQDAATAAQQTPLAKDHVFEYIDYSDLLDLIEESNEPVYVFYAYYEDVQSLSRINTLNTKAQEYEVETIYILSAEMYYNLEQDEKVESNKTFKEIQKREEKLGVDMETFGQLWVFEGGEIVFDSTDDIYDDKAVEFVYTMCFGKYAVKEPTPIN